MYGIHHIYFATDMMMMLGLCPQMSDILGTMPSTDEASIPTKTSHTKTHLFKLFVVCESPLHYFDGGRDLTPQSQ